MPINFILVATENGSGLMYSLLTPYYALLRPIFFLCASLVITACGGDNTGSSGRVQNMRDLALSCETPYQYTQPQNPETGITSAPLNTKPIDEALILQMLSELHCGGRDHGLNSILIEVEGELVVEEYYPGFISASNRFILDYNIDTLHVQASVQKSFVSALIGIAEDEGIIDVSETLYSIFPEYSDIDWFSPVEIGGITYQKADITLEDILKMSAGFEWDEGSIYYGHPNNPLTQMNLSDDPTRYILERPLVGIPGETFAYNTGLSEILKEIFQRKTGLTVAEYAQQTLFLGLNIDNFYWQRGLSLRPRDMLKLGKTYLNNGLFDGVQVVPEAWVENSLSSLLTLNSGERISGYGYQWWKSDFSIDDTIHQSNAALGYGGQQIYIFEEFDTVVIFTAAEYPGQLGDAFTTYSWLEDYIVPALIAGTPP